MDCSLSLIAVVFVSARLSAFEECLKKLTKTSARLLLLLLPPGCASTDHCMQVLKMKKPGYVPNFRLAFEHFCIHTGGRAVIEEIEKQLHLPSDSVQPSKDTLTRFGNTSSSSIWSVLWLWPFGMPKHYPSVTVLA